jgi:MFS superfamily sulfate permease-like transporter
VRWLVVDASAITGIDYSAGRTLKELQQDLKEKGVVLALTRVGADLKENIRQQELTEVIGANRIFTSRKKCLEAFRLESGKGDKH